jgi:hypothetical protein
MYLRFSLLKLLNGKLNLVLAFGSKRSLAGRNIDKYYFSTWHKIPKSLDFIQQRCENPTSTKGMLVSRAVKLYFLCL